MRQEKQIGATSPLSRISTSLPQMWKWNAFAIDTWEPLCKDESPLGKIFATLAYGGGLTDVWTDSSAPLIG